MIFDLDTECRSINIKQTLVVEFPLQKGQKTKLKNFVAVLLRSTIQARRYGLNIKYS